MYTHSLTTLLVVGPMLSAPAQAQDLNALIAEALSANPTIDAREFRVDELESLADAAGAWPDPMLAVEYSNVPVSTLSLSGHPMSGLQVRAQQMIRPPRWSAQHREVAGGRVEAAGHAVAESEVAIRGQVEIAWWELTRARALRRVTEAHVDRTEELLSAVRTRYETGRVGQHAVLRLEVLRDRLTDSLDDFERADVAWTARLNGLLAREEGKYVTPKSAEPASPPENAAALVVLARDTRPTLARLVAERETRARAADLARIDARPDPSVWTGYRLRTVQTATDPGADLVSVGVGVPLPTGSGKRANAARAGHLSGAESARAAYEADLDGVEAALEQLVAEWKRAAEKAALYESQLLPAAEAALETAFADFAVDKADFSSLFDAEVVLLQLDRARIIAVVDTQLAAARARALTGESTVGGAL